MTVLDKKLAKRSQTKHGSWIDFSIAEVLLWHTRSDVA